MVLKIVKDRFPIPPPDELARRQAAGREAKRGWSETDHTKPFLKEGAALGPAVEIPDELYPPHMRKAPEPVETFTFPTAKRADATYKNR